MTRSLVFEQWDPLGDKPALAENLRFRLAESLADRASLEPVDSPGRRSRESEAVDLLAQTPGDSSALTGFWLLLKADLLRRLGKPEEAETQLNAAVKSPSAPPASQVAEVKLPLLLDRKKYPEAIEFLKTAHVDPPARGALDRAHSPGRGCRPTLGGRSNGRGDRLVSCRGRAAKKTVTRIASGPARAGRKQAQPGRGPSS